jgi:sensor domain CHASE-containing protein
MTNLDTNTLLVLSVLGALVVLAIVAWALQRRRQSERLQQRFGTEYTRAVEHLGDREKAEAELLARERRVERLHIQPLAPPDAARFAQEWKLLQARFVDDPHRTLADADRLVREVMLMRGYPMGDFERRAADISVDHPAVVDHYRAAHAIALRDQHDATDTEDLRKAVVHYRALFDDLLEVADARPARRHTHHLPRMETH